MFAALFKLQVQSEESSSPVRSASFHVDPEPLETEGGGSIDCTAELRQEPESEGGETTAQLITTEPDSGA